jgi:hypothetical protein
MAIFDASGRLLAQNGKDNDNDFDPTLPELGSIPDDPLVYTKSGQGDDHDYVVAVMRVVIPPANTPFIIRVDQSMEMVDEELESLREILYSVVPVVLAIAGLGGLFLARKSLAPVVAMSERARQMGAIKAVKLGTEIDDPEGITMDGSYFYVIGSQSRKKGADQAGIVRFQFNKENQNVGQVQSISALKRFLLENVPELHGSAEVKAKDDGLNIEGVAWDPTLGRLLLGLRSPVVDGHALLVPLKLRDPRGPFSNDNLDAKGLEVLKVSLGGHGIRSIEYDERQKLFHIISGATEGQDKADFKLWEWGGPADRSKLREVTTFDSKLQPEGVTPASIDGSNFKFVVFDSSRYLRMP